MCEASDADVFTRKSATEERSWEASPDKKPLVTGCRFHSTVLFNWPQAA
jgi:hypothetical protein